MQADTYNFAENYMVSIETVKKWENKTRFPKINHIEVTANAMNIPIDTLVFGDYEDYAKMNNSNID